MGQAGQHWVGIGPRVVAWTDSAPADRVRLGVRDEGVYRVTAGELAAASGLTETAAREALDSGGWRLTCQGQTVAWTSDTDALYFYGVPTQELFAPENVYWLALGAGETMGVSNATPVAESATNQWFMHAASCRSSFVAPYDARDRRSTTATLTNVLNFGEWIRASTLIESERKQTRSLLLPGWSDTSATGLMVRVSLASYRDFPDTDSHTCEVLVNDVSCGGQSWTGERAVLFEYAASAGTATNGTIRLTVRNAGGTTAQADFMLLDAIVFYPRRYFAETGMVICAGGPERTVAAGGFASDRIGVWDITQPASPTALGTSRWQDTSGLWRVAFACGDAAKRYAVFDASGGCFEPSVCGVRDTDWCAPGAMPELAIVVPPRRWVSGFAAAVQPLADFRNAQGLRTRVVDAEELYNAFSDGLVHPEAFRRFSAAGVTNGPAQTLRYLLFAGHGGSDYKLDVFRLGETAPYPTLFPLYLLSQVEQSVSAAVLVPSDPVLGDATGGAAPEVAVGRFLATNAVELTGMVTKTIRYELTETWKQKAVFSADWQNVGQMYADFAGIASSTASGFPQAGWWLETFYPAADQSYLSPLWKYSYDETGIYYELREGAGFYYYVGHSSDTLAGNTSENKLFDAPMFRQANWTFAPVALLMGCRMGRWTLLDLKTEQQCIAEAGVRNRTSGFTAIISAAGYMETYEAENYSHAFRDQIAAGAVRLGDAWCGTFAALGDAASARLQHMTLLGDPSLCIRAGMTARGTPASWLISLALTNNPYADLSDQDGDGFATWQEYQAATDPFRGGLRIRSMTVPAEGASGLPLAFEPVGGLSYRVLSTTNLMSGLWEPLPWRADGGGAWSSSGIPGDWPVKILEVPYNREEPRRFYKVESQ